MKKYIGIVVLICFALFVSCACEKQEHGKDEFQRQYTSLYVEAYAGAQRNELTAVYDWLYPKNERLPLASDIELELRNIDEMTGTISFRLADESNLEIWEAKLDDTKRYLTVAAVLYGMQDGAVTVYYGSHAADENFTLSQLLETLSEESAYYRQSVEGMQQLAVELALDLTADDATKLWKMCQGVQWQYHETVDLLSSEDAAYDVQLFSCFFDENAETGRYKMLAYVLKDKELHTDEKSDEAYAKAAEILMNQYAQIEQITFCILTETNKNSYETEKELVFDSSWK